jgi:type II secretory pathway component GspD/PulD (secretin)
MVFAGVCGFGASKTAGPSRYRIETLKHISAEQGIDYLKALHIGPVSQLGQTNKLLVTAPSDEIFKASSLLKVVDCPEDYVIEVLRPAKEAEQLPAKELITAEAGGDLVIGTFLEVPMSTNCKGVIIDIHRDAVILIAPEGDVENIKGAISKLRKTKEVQPEPVESVIGIEVIERAVPGDINSIGQGRTEISSELDRLAASLGSSQKAANINEIKTEDLFGSLLDSIEPKEKAAITVSKVGKPEVESPMVKISETDYKAIIERLAALEAKTEQKVAKVEETEVKEPEEPAEPNFVVRSYEPKAIVDGNEVLDIKLPEKLTIDALLGLVGEYLHLDYMYDATKIRGDVTLKLQGKLDGKIRVKDLYPLLESVLKFKGLVMTRKGNLVTIVQADTALDIDPMLIDDKTGEIKTGDVIITRIFQLRHIDAESAKNLLTSMKVALANDINTSAGDSGILIVTGFAYRMKRIEQLLSMVDIPGEPKQFRSRQLKYTMAESLSTKVKALAEQLGTVSITIGAAPTAPARPTTPRGRAARTRPTVKPKAPVPAKEGVYIEADERTNRILMIGLDSQLNMVEELIESLDVQKQDLRNLRLYDIQHVGAEEVQQKLQELGIISRGAVSSRSRSGAGRITATQRRAPTARSAAAAKGAPTAATAVVDVKSGALVEEPQVIVVEATNSLLVNATPEQHEQIVTIISYVDSETLESANPYEIYPLENQKPEDLAAILEKLIQETVQDKEGKVERVVQRREEDIVIVPDPSTFSIIVYASRKNQEWIRNLIKTLDRRRPQVLIDVTLVEVTKGDAFTYDLDAVTAFPDLLNTSGVLGGVGGKSIDTILSSLAGSGDPNNPGKPKRNRYMEASSSGGVGRGFYADHHIQALLTLMQSKSYGRVLARPKILVNDGMAGTISTTTTTNVKLSGSIIPPTQGGSQITTTSFQAYDAGVNLTITPNISEGDLLLLEIQLQRSDFLQGTSTEAPPDLLSSDIQTIVTVPNNRTIILGGMLKLNQTKGSSKVPLLGDLPLIGTLFRSTSNSALDSKLYIFVKANILRPNETLTGLPELVRISGEQQRAFEKAETEFQEYQNWPGIKPQPMDPLKVLEAE